MTSSDNNRTTLDCKLEGAVVQLVWILTGNGDDAFSFVVVVTVTSYPAEANAWAKW